MVGHDSDNDNDSDSDSLNVCQFAVRGNRAVCAN